ncbi:ferritin-like domain-containing protein [Hymenobacter cellulosivorans]|uniref:PA2169 family four-helix-bundle protein n=1 Tax=Hymenobacter cellulosivorans TaxID=2932249 RepID=A0ABY4FDT2_9BACT|nr:PA2169 family four-helix-bundle protein [Hymenobacter cellulosivorans]UOQ54831.1 PA2169 family four-helix-bundle protein [Hymenobacter cellulosivorans]
MSTSHQPTRSGSASSYNSASLGSSNADGSLLGQASKWLNKGSVGDMLGRMTTTQKVVGGALLAVGVSALLRGNKSKASKASGAGSDAQVDTLNELLYFVNDRIEGYQRAVEESQDPQNTGYYKQLVSQSQQFANELNGFLRQQGGSRQDSTTVKGKFYRAWMDTKAAITGADEKAILGSNIYGEEWAIKAYEDALSDNTLRGPVRQAVERQYQHSKQTYNRLKGMEGKQE